MMRLGWPWGYVPLRKEEYEKLLEKAEKYDELKKTDNKIIYDLSHKLEAAKKLVEKGPPLNVDTLEDCQQAVDDWLGKLMNFLEAGE